MVSNLNGWKVQVTDPRSFNERVILNIFPFCQAPVLWSELSTHHPWYLAWARNLLHKYNLHPPSTSICQGKILLFINEISPRKMVVLSGQKFFFWAREGQLHTIKHAFGHLWEERTWRAGKTSILNVLFNRLPPKQTFYLETTIRITKHIFEWVHYLSML